MMACGARLPSRLEWLRKAVCEYIEDEYGHEQWILNDIETCGGDKAAVRDGRPSLPIELMVSYLYDLIARGNPVGLFGMVNVLEGTSIALATHAAESIRERLDLPQSAFSYLSSHGSLDIEHMQTYRRLMNTLDDPADQAAVIHASKVVYALYTDMFRGLPRDGRSPMRLSEARVVLTGASGGIGLAIATALCASGARVLAVARHREPLVPLLERYPQQLSWVGADLTFLTDRRKVLAAAEGLGG